MNKTKYNNSNRFFMLSYIPTTTSYHLQTSCCKKKLTSYEYTTLENGNGHSTANMKGNTWYSTSSFQGISLIISDCILAYDSKWIFRLFIEFNWDIVNSDFSNCAFQDLRWEKWNIELDISMHTYADFWAYWGGRILVDGVK